ncbi:MAG: HEPN domain containing protein [Candidatus Methanohalarchaeum thermophilum]|uniref:HEPN domain containing protein n=1 Tax=Methanohalarchaeum thermophilum TaxID=1903181 RepID=A0A1Q6DSS4_METT1|nr:MAG: HEPN domain containing protein [Candidatus Methanohalarchaeum thermophilum]
MNEEKETIKSKIEVIKENLDYLEEEEFSPRESSFRVIQAIRHSLFEAIQASIDIASHIISEEGYKRPNNYSDLFLKLSKEDILSDELGKRLAQMSKFRNVLIHRYGELSDREIKEIIENDLKDLKDFLEQIYDYMEED